MEGRRGVNHHESMIAKIHQKGTNECCTKKEEGYGDKARKEMNPDALTYSSDSPKEKRGHTSN